MEKKYNWKNFLCYFEVFGSKIHKVSLSFEVFIVELRWLSKITLTFPISFCRKFDFLIPLWLHSFTDSFQQRIKNFFIINVDLSINVTSLNFNFIPISVNSFKEILCWNDILFLPSLTQFRSYNLQVIFKFYFIFLVFEKKPNKDKFLIKVFSWFEHFNFSSFFSF